VPFNIPFCLVLTCTEFAGHSRSRNAVHEQDQQGCFVAMYSVAVLFAAESSPIRKTERSAIAGIRKNFQESILYFVDSKVLAERGGFEPFT